MFLRAFFAIFFQKNYKFQKNHTKNTYICIFNFSFIIIKKQNGNNFIVGYFQLGY